MPDGSDPLPVDEDPIGTINYGGGARWFAKKHMAFSLDVRFYEIKEDRRNPGCLAARMRSCS